MKSDHKERRGEPVVITCQSGEVFGVNPPLLGTIEWGNDQEGYSVCTEPGGARYQLQAKDFVSQPGGSRPLWERRCAENGETARMAAQKKIDAAAREVVWWAMFEMGYRDHVLPPDGSTRDTLAEACATLDRAEKRLKAVTILGVRNTTEDP